MNNNELATQLLYLLHQVNQAPCEYAEGNTIDAAYSRQDSVYGKLQAALEIVAPERLQAYIETGDLIL